MKITVETRNTDWGFYGSIRHHHASADAWPRAVAAVARATDCPDEAVRDFLDSRHGRHFADDVANGLFQGLGIEGAIEAAIKRWLHWRIDRKTAREYGIPQGLPYLTGWVTHFEIAAEYAD